MYLLVATELGHRGPAICANGALVHHLRHEAVVEQYLLDPAAVLGVVDRVREEHPGTAAPVAPVQDLLDRPAAARPGARFAFWGRSWHPLPMELNWLAPVAEARPVGDKGWGSFANTVIPAGTTVAAFGGHVVPRVVLESLPIDRQNRSIQVDDELFLASAEIPEPGDMVNHSCEPNCGLVGAIVVVAMRDIAVGEELTFDYAMCDGTDYDEFTCQCGSWRCRGTVTGHDWRLPELQLRYAGWFSPYLARRIARLTDPTLLTVG